MENFIFFLTPFLSHFWVLSPPTLTVARFISPTPLSFQDNLVQDFWKVRYAIKRLL